MIGICIFPGSQQLVSVIITSVKRTSIHSLASASVQDAIRPLLQPHYATQSFPHDSYRYLPNVIQSHVEGCQI